MSCRSLVQGLEDLYQDYEDQGFVAISVVAQDGAGQIPDSEDAAEWADELGLTFPVLADADGTFFPIWDPELVLPVAYIIDQDGVISWAEAGGAGGLPEMESQIVALLESPKTR